MNDQRFDTLSDPETSGGFPFDVVELERPTAQVEALFRQSFGSSPPGEPWHFAALLRPPRPALLGAYVHYSTFEPGVYLLGGLCVDSRLYRRLPASDRREIAAQYSLSRWILGESIARLGMKRAVFAFTGDIRSRRDGERIGFVPASCGHLIVQWHAEPPEARAELVGRIQALGPF